MIVMALIALFGLVAVILLYFFFVSRGAAHRAAAKADIEREVALKLRKAQEVDAELVNAVTAGAAVDQAIADYQRGRAAVLNREKTDQAWAWTADDLEAWKRREARRRYEEINRRSLVPAITTCLLVVTLTLAAIVVYYQFMAAQPGTLPPGQGGSQPAGLPPPAPAAPATPPPAPPPVAPSPTPDPDAFL